MSFWANAHKLGWATDAQLKRARELGKDIVTNESDRNYYKALVLNTKWTIDMYEEIVGESYVG